MSYIHLLRCKAEPLPQLDAFTKSMASTEIVANSFLARPTAKVPRGAVWHVGNTVTIEYAGVYFALGREAVLNAPRFDVATREFEEAEQAQAPFTIGVYDPDSQVAGVLIRPGVSMSAREVATKLQILLRSTGIDREHNTQIVVDPIPDPRGFIEILRSASRITRFEFDFSVPNPPDDEKYIQRPLKKFAQRIGATEGRASVRGPSLDPEELVELTLAVAAEGDHAAANVEMTPGSGIVKKALDNSPLREPVDVKGQAGPAILEAVRRAYRRLRNPNEFA
jgi:hypothetical protein